MQRLEAEILFDDADAMTKGKAALTEAGFEVEVFDFVLDWDPLPIWAKVRIGTDLPASGFSRLAARHRRPV